MPACPRCRERIDVRARFCPACGASLAAGAPPGGEVRKTVTVVFADVADSTGLGERLDPEAIRRVMARYFDEARAVVERHDGTVEKFIGDAVMAVFGIPTLHEDDALRAVRAAAELRGRLAALETDFQHEWGIELQVRIGVNTGEVLAGVPSQGQAFATGDAVNVAARLQQAAAPGEILVGTATHRLVRDAVRLEPVEPLALKGKAERVPAWRLLEILPDVRAFMAPLGTRFVGRKRELEGLKAVFERSITKAACQLVTVVGPPGVGKSRLVRELIVSIGDRARVVVGRCPPYGEGITYSPLAEVVKQVAGADPTALAEIVAGAESADLIVEGVAGAVGLVETEARTEEIFWAVRRLFERLADERPLIAVIDDIHWAESTFLDLLEYLAGFGRARILLLCIARPDLLDARPSWGTPRENTSLLGLDPLSDPEADTLIEELLSGAELSERFRRRILEAAEGHPLFVEQMAALAREADPGDGELAVPPTMQALLAARIDRLEPGERVVVERASVEGRIFHGGAVSALLPATEREQLPTHLMALVRKELIGPYQSEFAGEDGFRFAHTLIRDAAYDAMPKELRAELHERFADWTEAKSPQLDEIVGFHLEQAVRYRSQVAALGEAEYELARRACERLGFAGRRALARGDMPAAANLLERAAGLLPSDAPERLELLVELGEALGHAGELARAEAVLGEAIDRAAGDERLECHARLQRSFLHRYTQPQAGSEELLAAAERAIRVFDRSGDDAGLSRAWRLVAEVHWTRCQIGLMESALEHAQEHARRAGEEHEPLLILDGLARAAFAGPTPVPAAILRCKQIGEKGVGRLTLQAVVATIQAYLEAMRGRFDEARTLCAQGTSILEELGDVVYLAALQAWTGEIEMLAGDASAAERVRRAAYETLDAIGERGILSTVAAYLAESLHAQGRDEEAGWFTTRSEEAAATDDVTSQVLWRVTRAKILAQKSEHESAERLARQAVATASKTDYLNLHADALVSMSTVLFAAGRAEEAAKSAREALDLYEAKGNVVSAGRARAWIEDRAVTAVASRDDQAS